ncbi:MAG TPA: L-histidine N(alpha)-methyltransferase [Steroidobacteraceae bacterium]
MTPRNPRPAPRASRPDATDWLLVEDVLAGLHATPKRLSPAYLYDRRGSQLFEAICDLPEYYLTRTETGILARHAVEMAACIGAGALLLEPGSGSSRKTRLLLDALPDLGAYVPVDISRTHLLEAARALQAAYPRLEVLPVCADFTQGFTLPPSRRPPSRVVVFFPGSTLGNFDAPEAIRLLELMRRTAGAGGGLLVGIDLAKDRAILERAYNDAAGITAAFNMNLLVRLNHELAADFDIGSFSHEAIWVPAQSRIEMHLVSARAQAVHVAGESVQFAAGERLVTEHCHKYTADSFASQARSAGWIPRRSWSDARGYFSVQYLETV